jgi:uncharacterized protein YbjQ (UPF0145 family)
MTESNVVDTLDLDADILARRLGGLSIRRLAREFSITQTAVLNSLDRSLPQLSPQLRTRLYREDLQRLETLIGAHWASAATGSQSSTQLVLRLLERRAAMLGADAATRIDVVVEQVGATPDSTSQLLAMLDQIAAERSAPEGLLIEGKVVDEPPTDMS